MFSPEMSTSRERNKDKTLYEESPSEEAQVNTRKTKREKPLTVLQHTTNMHVY